jgi:hypothetical protein
MEIQETTHVLESSFTATEVIFILSSFLPNMSHIHSQRFFGLVHKTVVKQVKHDMLRQPFPCGGGPAFSNGEVVAASLCAATVLTVTSIVCVLVAVRKSTRQTLQLCQILERYASISHEQQESPRVTHLRLEHHTSSQGSSSSATEEEQMMVHVSWGLALSPGSRLCHHHVLASLKKDGRLVAMSPGDTMRIGEVRHAPPSSDEKYVVTFSNLAFLNRGGDCDDRRHAAFEEDDVVHAYDLSIIAVDDRGRHSRVETLTVDAKQLSLGWTVEDMRTLSS